MVCRSSWAARNRRRGGSFMQNEGWSTLTQEFNQGASISRSEPSDIRQLWEASSRIPGEERWQSQRAMGFGAFGCGIDPSSRSPEQLFAITIRLQLLSALLRRGVLDDYMQDTNREIGFSVPLQPCHARRTTWHRP